MTNIETVKMNRTQEKEVLEGVVNQMDRTELHTLLMGLIQSSNTITRKRMFELVNETENLEISLLENGIIEEE